MGGTVTGAKTDVKRLYAGIVAQALKDWDIACKTDNRSVKNEIRRFFRSEWGKQILDTLNLDINVINDKYCIYSK